MAPSAGAGSSSIVASGGTAGRSATSSDAGAPGAGTNAASGGASSADTSATGGASAGGSATGGAGNSVSLRYCDTIAPPGADASDFPDWSCVTATKNNATDTPGVALSGTFLAVSSNTTFDSFEYCAISLTSCEDTNSPLPDFAFTSTQEGCAIINWHEGDAAYSATMWQTITHAPSLVIGTVPLVTPSEIQLLASALAVPITAPGAALIGIKDCSGNMAPGVRFAAQNSTGQVMGLHFSIQEDFSVPVPDPTGSSGMGGLANLTPGAATVYGYVEDGCIVAEARIVSEASRIAYVYLVPNGYGDSGS